MPIALNAFCQEKLRRAGLPGPVSLARLLSVLRATPQTHLGLSDVARTAKSSGRVAARAELARQLETLADHGLLGRLPGTAAEPVFDTVAEPHSHLIYEDSVQRVDLHVSAKHCLRSSARSWPRGRAQSRCWSAFARSGAGPRRSG